MQCPNECGTVSEIKKPSLVPILSEVQEYVEVDWESDDFQIPAFRLIMQICLECGYYTSIPLTQEMFEEYIRSGRIKNE